MHIDLLANAGSVHVLRWLGLLTSSEMDVRGYTVDAVPEMQQGRWTRVSSLRGSVRYFVGGIALRFQPSGARLLHAHNASGYGTMALLSGRPYVLTVYGSEVYSATERGIAYRILLRHVLRRARLITCTTAAMRDQLIRVHQVAPQRVRMFSLGLPLGAFKRSAEEKIAAKQRLGIQHARVVISNRRVRPQYRIDLLIDAFILLHRRDPAYRLIVLEGDATAAYVEKMRRKVEDAGIGGAVLWVAGIRTQEEVQDLLAASDIAVSIPTSDQLSASILEALAAGVRVVAAPIPAYDDLFRSDLAAPANLQSASMLANAIGHQADLLLEAGDGWRTRAHQWLESEHSDRSVLRHVEALYEDATARRV